MLSFAVVTPSLNQGAFIERTIRSVLDQTFRAFELIVVGAAHMHALGSEPTGEPIDTEQLWQFCLGGLIGGSAPKKSARRKR